jgi:putative ABC transport system substrate-binding protein
MFSISKIAIFSVFSEPQMKSDRMRRRDFIPLLGSAAALASVGAHAQTPKLPVIGFLIDGPLARVATYVAAFREGMSTLGYAEGRNVTITYRSTQGKSDQLGTLANDLAHSQVQLIVASGGVIAAKAAMKATASIPILGSSLNRVGNFCLDNAGKLCIS